MKTRPKNVSHAWFFDVDGVLVDPVSRRVRFPEIIRRIKKLLEKGEPVFLVTGRPVSWVETTVLNWLKLKQTKREILNRLRLFGEHGGTELFFDNGKKKLLIRKQYAVDKKFRDDLSQYLKDHYHRSMFLDETKYVGATAERKTGVGDKIFFADQKEVLKFLGDSADLDRSRFKLETTILSIDILHKNLGKRFCVEQALAWLKRQKIEPGEFMVVGDSGQDLKMAERLHQLKKKTKFVYVGARKDIDLKVSFPVIKTKQVFDRGTREILRRFSQK